MGSFKDRVVLIESVGDDIAYAIARMAASKGAKLALLDIDGKKRRTRLPDSSRTE